MCPQHGPALNLDRETMAAAMSIYLDQWATGKFSHLLVLGNPHHLHLPAGDCHQVQGDHHCQVGTLILLGFHQTSSQMCPSSWWYNFLVQNQGPIWISAEITTMLKLDRSHSIEVVLVLLSKLPNDSLNILGSYGQIIHINFNVTHTDPWPSSSKHQGQPWMGWISCLWEYLQTSHAI